MKKLSVLKQEMTSAKLKRAKLNDLKGGRQYVTKSEADFMAKRDKLQRQGANMNINHEGDMYCIEW